jgi:transposase
MKRTRNGRRRYTREFKLAAVHRVAEGERSGDVARDLGIKYHVLRRWVKQAAKGEELHEWGRPKQRRPTDTSKATQRSQRIAELERLVGRQQLEIRFLDRALRRVEELRQGKNDDGEVASSKR